MSSRALFDTLLWLIALEGAVFLIAVWHHAPAWIVILCAAAYALIMLVYLGVYCFFLAKDHEALRERRANWDEIFDALRSQGKKD